MTTIAELKEHLESYTDETPCAYALWLPEDVICEAEGKNITLSEEQIADILHTVHRRHDAVYGITWENIYQAILDIVQSAEDEQE
jgi:hypothetical protein